MHEWLSVIIVLLILGVLLDGIRRMRITRKDNIKISGKADELKAEDIEVSTSEFPSGGARIAGFRPEEDASQLKNVFKQNYQDTKKTVGIRELECDVEMTGKANLKLTPDSDLNDSRCSSVADEYTNEPALGNIDDLPAFDDDGLSKARARGRAEGDVLPKVLPEPRQEPRLMNTALLDEAEDLDGEGYHEMIIIHIVANAGYVFSGKDLLQAITDQGLRFGEMDIFHGHENDDGTGSILFSMVNMLKPGSFDLSNIETFETPGVSLFMDLPVESNSLHAFRTMTRVAKGIASALDADLKDENHSVITQQTIEHCRQRVIEFDRKQRLENA